MKELFELKPPVEKQVKGNKLPSNPDKGSRGRFPAWLHRKMPQKSELFQTDDIVNKYRLNTVCEEAKCPNRLECYSKKTATFLALGSACTRACGFCDIDFSKNPPPPEKDEPMRIAKSAQELGLKHVVITMVARDDLSDQGSNHIADIIHTVRQESPDTTIEVLTSDFSGDIDAINTVIDAKPEIYNYNIETVRRLTPKVRHKATYDRTLMLLSHVKKSKKIPFLKSGIMVGLGEEPFEVEETLRDLHTAGCDVVTIGQYLQANQYKLRVKEFVTPDQFDAYAAFGEKIGISQVYAGPFIRSSYNASLVLERSRHAKSQG